MVLVWQSSQKTKLPLKRLRSTFMRLNVKVHPKSSKRAVVQKSPHLYEVWVHEPPDKGKANEAVIESLSEHLNIPRSKFELVSGKTSKLKTFNVSYEL